MEFSRASSPFGAPTRTRVLVALSLLRSSYPRELARLMDASLTGVLKGLASLERDGLIVGRLIGRSRVYTFNPAYFARTELSRYVTKLAEADERLRARTEQLRRRPRRRGKPL